MRLRAGCELVFEVERETPLVMMLRARPGAAQQVLEESLIVGPKADPVTEFTDVFGNRCDRLVAARGELAVRSEIVADVLSEVEVDARAPRAPVARLPHAALHYTLPSRYCPSDKMQGLALEITRDAEPGYQEVCAIRDYVRSQIDYRYGVSDSSTDALDTLQAGAGVCRDFAHVAVALCRSIDIPARMVVGYLHGREPMDLHAWFEAYVGSRWYTFDASEESLRGGRVVVAHGRDAADVAFVTDYGALKLRSMRVSVNELAAPEVTRRIAVGA